MFQPYKEVPQEELDRLSKRVTCLECGGDVGSYSHLNVGFSTTWPCSKCGLYHDLIIKHNGIDVEISLGRDRKPRRVSNTTDILQLDPELVEDDGRAVYLLVRGMSWSDNDKEKENPREGDTYHYNSGTCPTNYLQDVIEIIEVFPDGQVDSDPHGIFKFVAAADKLECPVSYKVGADGYLDTDQFIDEDYEQLIKAALEHKEQNLDYWDVCD